MFIVNSYTLAIIFCFITMICWGSWGNTQKLASKNWRYELLLLGLYNRYLIICLTSRFHTRKFRRFGERFSGRYPASRYQIHSQCLDRRNYFQCFQHLTFEASVSIAGMAVAFPLGVGLCLGPRCVHQLFQHS